MFARFTLAITSALFLIGCEPDYSESVAKLESLIKSRRLGTSSDAWIVKRNGVGEFEKVGLIFGFVNDKEFCEVILQQYKLKEPQDNYICQPAN